MKTTKLVLFTILAISFLFISGCDVNPSKVEDKYAKAFIENITYVKDHRTGLCFALVASRKTADTDQSGLGLTDVPCERVEQFLVK